MAIDTKAIKEHIRGILIALGDDPDREGLKDTPDRVARMYNEVFEGMNYTNEQIAQMFGKTFEDEMDFESDSKDVVVVKDIQLFSYCEHHIALMYDMTATVAYVPNGKVIGLSKIARIADMVSKRLQLQERIGSDIAQIMQMVTENTRSLNGRIGVVLFADGLWVKDITLHRAKAMIKEKANIVMNVDST